MNHLSTTRPASWILLVSLVGLLAACSGSPTRSDEPVGPTYPGHLAYVGADAMMVISGDNVTDHLAKITSSNAYAELRRMVTEGAADPELVEMLDLVERAVSDLGPMLAGRVTVVLYGPPPVDPGAPISASADEELVIILDGDARAVVTRLVELAGEEVAFVPMEDGVEKFGPPGGNDAAFLRQVGPVGVVSTSRALLDTTVTLGEADGPRLAEKPEFQKVTRELSGEADIFFYLADWSQAESDWDRMLTGDKPKGGQEGIAGTANLDGGIDIELVLAFDETNVDDAEASRLLPAMRSANLKGSPTIPRLVPKDTLLYAGFNMSAEDLAPLLAEYAEEIRADLPPAQAEELISIIREFVSAFEGEFGLAVTSVPAEGPPSVLLGMTPVPGVVLVGKLADNAREDNLRKIIEALLGSFATGPQPMLTNRREEHAFSAQMVLYSTTLDPAIEVGFAFVDGYLAVGSRAGLLDFLQTHARQDQSLAEASESEVVRQSLATPSNYVIHANLRGIWEFVDGRYGALLGMMAQNVGGPISAVGVLTQVFPVVGGRITIKRDVATMRIYVTAEDLDSNL